MTANGDTLTWGNNTLVPNDSLGAWGARLIVTQDGSVDLLADRQGCAGPDRDRILDEMERILPLPVLREELRELLVSGEMNTRVAKDFTLIDTDTIKVHANTNASAGYCYVTAWLVN